MAAESGKEPPRYREGRQPWDPINGMRVGALAGALLGAIAAAFWSPFLIVVGAVAGGAVGYLDQRRKLRDR